MCAMFGGEGRCVHLEGREASPAEIIYGVPEEGVARYEKEKDRKEGNNLKSFRGWDLKDRARIWP